MGWSRTLEQERKIIAAEAQSISFHIILYGAAAGVCVYIHVFARGDDIRAYLSKNWFLWRRQGMRGMRNILLGGVRRRVYIYTASRRAQYRIFSNSPATEILLVLAHRSEKPRSQNIIKMGTERPRARFVRYTLQYAIIFQLLPSSTNTHNERRCHLSFQRL